MVTFARGLVVLITALAPAIVLLNRELMAVHWPIVVVLFIAGWVALLVLAFRPIVRGVQTCPLSTPQPKR